MLHRSSRQRRLLIVMTGFLLAATVWLGRGNWMGVAAAQEKGKSPADRRPIVLDRAPVHIISDPNPVFSGIAMDDKRAEVFITNDNEPSEPSINVFPAAFPVSDGIIEPRRRIAGPKADLGLPCGIAISTEFNEMYTVSGDGQDVVIFPLDAKGDVAPSRTLEVPHASGGVFLDVKNDELYVTTEHANKLSIFRREATGHEEPVRIIQGPNSGLADPRTIYVNSTTDEIFITNHGSWRRTETGEGWALHGDSKLARQRGSQSHPGIVEPLTPSTGKFMPPSVTVYSRKGSGDVAPVRIIQGTKTRLNVPLGLASDRVSRQIVVVNGGDDSVLFFDERANGNVAPVRVIKGPATNLNGPTGVMIDTQRDELWVTSWENHATNVYSRTAEGNAAPLRILRSAPKGAALATLGRPSGLAYDSKRKQIMAPNWVSHPRISAFASSADGNAHASRVIEGQGTLQARTNHEIGYDYVNDEIVAPNPFAQAILFFRGGAEGEEAPLRVIQGPKTMLGYTDTATVDPIHGEVFTVQFRTNSILVFNRLPAGDVAPIRIIHGPKTQLDRPQRISVDPINNLIAITSIQGAWIFNRTDNGDVAPKWIIWGPKTGVGGENKRLATPLFSPQGKKILITGETGGRDDPKAEHFVGVWNYGDNGDVPPWAILKGNATTKMKRASSLALNTDDKNLVVISTGRLISYHLPELFEPSK